MATRAWYAMAERRSRPWQESTNCVSESYSLPGGDGFM